MNEIDYKNLKVDVNTKKGKKTYYLDAFPMEVYQWLACYGFAYFISNKVDPDRTFERLKQGKIGGKIRSRYPKAVRAMSLIMEVPLESAWKQWKGWSKDERREMMKNPEIQKKMIDLRYGL